MEAEKNRSWKTRELERLRRQRRRDHYNELMKSSQLQELVSQLPHVPDVDTTTLQSWRPSQRDMHRFEKWNISGLLLALTGYNQAYIEPPYEGLEPTTEYSGNPPITQYVAANTDGVLQIVTSIGDDSSNTFSKAEYQVRIDPMFGAPYSRLSFRPWVQYWAQRYLSAAGAGESHSNGYIRSTVVSTDADGGDFRWEADSRGIQIWDDRFSGGTFGDELGHALDSQDPDFEDTVTNWQDLEVWLDDMDKSRIYFGRVRIESQSDADGGHLLYASHAQVAFYATVKWIWAEQAGPQYHGWVGSHPYGG
jgi:hypothetical protein